METMKKFVGVIFKILGVLVFLLVVADLALLSNITAEGIVITLGIVSALLLALIFLIKKKEGEQYGILGKIKRIFPGKTGEENKKNLTWAFFVGAVVLLIIITLPIEGNHEAIFPLVVALMVLVLISTVWPETFKSTVMRWAIYIYALVVMDLCFMNLFPVLMVKHAHFDPDWLKTTLVEKELYKLHKTEREIADQSRAREIARITEKVKRGENLSETEKQVVKDATESTLRQEEKKPREVAQATTGKLCWQETEKGTGWRKDVKNEKGCFGAKILENEKTHLLVKYKTKDGHGTCDWDKLKDPQYGEWKEVGRNNGGNCMLTQVSRELFTGWFESHYDTKGRYIPGYRDKYFVELRLN